MTTELFVDYTTTEGIRTALKKIQSHRHYMIMMQGELEMYIKKLNELEKDCINAVIMGDGYPHRSSKLYIPTNLCQQTQ